MKRENLFRGKSVVTGEWVYGDLVHSHKTPVALIIPLDCDWITDYVVVIPDTVGQLRYENNHGKYFDGDVYYHAGYGREEVSELCELQNALMYGTSEDIGEILGSIHDNPELIK